MMRIWWFNVSARKYHCILKPSLLLAPFITLITRCYSFLTIAASENCRVMLFLYPAVMIQQNYLTCIQYRERNITDHI